MLAVLLLIAGFLPSSTSAQNVRPSDSFPGYQKTPDSVARILDAPTAPWIDLSPTLDEALLLDEIPYRPISDLAGPALGLAGWKINTKANARLVSTHLVAFHLFNLRNGARTDVRTPAHPWLSVPEWSPNGSKFVFTNRRSDGVDLWIGESKNHFTRQIPDVQVNGVIDKPIQWMPDSRNLLVAAICKNCRFSGDNLASLEPIAQESDGKLSPARTYPDLLHNPHDEDLFDYYAESQLEFIDTHNFHSAKVGSPGIYTAIDPSPDGKHLLVTRLHHPYSYLLRSQDFPREVEVWSSSGKLEFKLASLPLRDHIPIQGVPTGPRSYEWVPSEPATLMWVEALDGGDPKTKTDFRDHLLTLKAPFTDKPSELAKLQQRYAGIFWDENGLALIRDFDRDRFWLRTFQIRIGEPQEALHLILEYSTKDRYQDPGLPLMKTLPNGKAVLCRAGDFIFLVGSGASPDGAHPFLDKFDLASLRKEHLFRSEEGVYEQVLYITSPDGTQFITRRESLTEAPNYFLRKTGAADKTAITKVPPQSLELLRITKRVVTYKRADGVPLSFTLYLPPGYKNGERLPTILWSYPVEFIDAATAGQVLDSPYRFTTLTGVSPLFLPLEGYAVLYNASMPIIGAVESANNSYLEQIAADAQAAVDTAIEIGVTDPNRVGVAGNSYGAAMAANLLFHTSLFRAGVALNGAFNRTLTPFGFQNERRTFWEAPEVYMKMSPFMYANQPERPLLLIHGMADDNPGTSPMQSERMYEAIKGNGGIVRYVQLPYEGHTYAARESVEDALAEIIHWFDRWVKNASAKTGDTAKSNRDIHVR